MSAMRRVSLETVTNPAETFHAQRRRLLGLAYRLLGAASANPDKLGFAARQAAGLSRSAELSGPLLVTGGS